MKSPKVTKRKRTVEQRDRRTAVQRMRDAVQPATGGPVIQEPPGGIAKVVKGPTEKPKVVKPKKP
jgi:hypothetical protein